ncbi:MAG TPA: lantibiotic dehydratase, partial [Streptosporangiaceae bacterium]|nr:lantibiotic dehydratase [Streptosporangiaceae bacterium]
MRSAGFPAGLLAALCDEPLAAAADQAAAGQAAAGQADPARVATVYREAAGRLSRAVAAVYADPLFREALTWQNPGLAQFLHDHDKGPGAPRLSKQRQRELVIASYLQRYCLKNDTIGFFGPVGWASVHPGTPGLAVTPGEQLLARRTTYFEVWAVDKIAAVIARQGRELGWLVPRRTRSVFLDGTMLHRPHRKPVTLTPAELAILHACDGHHTINDL